MGLSIMEVGGEEDEDEDEDEDKRSRRRSEINVWVQRVLGHLHTTSRYHQGVGFVVVVAVVSVRVGRVAWSMRGVYDGVGGARV
ncbi:unnamed protein product [Lupinus luteus]|uniref:Uncharacterized protein n=1 Tax=Lupinus luteus TaxID=3873 RepID=A0AAV1XFB4_LUPLU